MTIGISVLLPVHNGEKTVKRAVLSTLRALPENSELLIFQDGCTDDTEEIVNSISDSRIRVFSSIEKIGVAAALNRLLSQSNYPYVARMDADDIVLPWRFKKQLKSIIRRESDFEFSNALYFYGKSFLIRYNFRASMDDAESKKSLGNYNPFIHSTAIAKREAIDKLGGYHEVPAEDYNLWLRAASQGFKFHRSARIDVLFRIHPMQISKDSNWIAMNEKDQETIGLAKSMSSSEAPLRHAFLEETLERKGWVLSSKDIFRRALIALETSRKQGRLGTGGDIRKNRFLSLLDSAIYRAGISFLTLALALIANFELIAFYATVTLVLGIFQALFEGIIRNVSVRHFQNHRDLAEVQRLAKLGAILFSFLLFAAVLFSGSRHDMPMDVTLSALPIVIAPYVIARSAMRQREFQVVSNWSRLAKVRLQTTLPILILCLTGTLLTKSVFFAACFVGLTEFLIYRRLGMDPLAARAASPIDLEYFSRTKEIGGMLAFQFATWLKSQADRIVFVIVANSSTAGLYFIAASLAKTPNEVITQGLISHQRNLLGAASDLSTQREVTTRSISILAWLNSVGYLSTIGSVLVLSLLSTNFKDVLTIASILLIPTFLLSASSAVWTSSIHTSGAQGKKASQVVGALSITCVALVGTSNLLLGCWLLAMRDILNSTWILYRWRSLYAPVKLLLPISLTSLAVSIGLYLSLRI